ncbi:response regulator transcription factor [Patescibacteria group bacterium]
MRILVVEDENKIATFIKKGLEAERHAVDVALDGEIGLQKCMRDVYDLIILDLILPKLEGEEICKSVREEGINTPIIILTSKDSTEDKIKGLDSGADDYLTKPFSFDELVARVRALLRRQTNKSKTDLIESGDLMIDLKKHMVLLKKREIILSAKEFSLLEYLARNAGEVVTRTQITEHVWDQNYDSFTNVVDVYIRYLRKKLDGRRQKSLIETVRGVGYRLQV